MALTFLFVLALFWLAVHAIYSRFKSSEHILPLVNNSRRKQRVKVHLKTVHLRIESTAFNSTHDALSVTLSRRPLIKQFLRLFYDAGVIIGVLGMAISIGLLAHTALQLAQILFLSSPTPAPSLVKRAPVEASPSPPTTSSDALQIHLLVSLHAAIKFTY
jgi:hypothetical protein